MAAAADGDGQTMPARELDRGNDVHHTGAAYDYRGGRRSITFSETPTSRRKREHE